MLIFIYYFKNILSINDIQTLLTPITQKYFKSMTEKDMTYIYNEVFSMEKEQIESLKKTCCANTKQHRILSGTQMKKIRQI